MMQTNPYDYSQKMVPQSAAMPPNQNGMPPPGSGALAGYPSFGSNMFAGSMYGGYAMGGSMYGSAFYQEDIVVTKLFSSRRDLLSMASTGDFGRRYDSQWNIYDSTGNVRGGSTYGSLYQKDDAGAAGVGSTGAGRPGRAASDLSSEEPVKRDSVPSSKRETPASRTKETPSSTSAPKAPPAKSSSTDAKSKTSKPTPSKPLPCAPPQRQRELIAPLPYKDDDDDIPMVREAPPATAVPPKSQQARNGPALKPESEAAHSGRHRPSSRARPSRPYSRTTSMNDIEFPKAQEIADPVGDSGLQSPTKEALEEARRAVSEERQARKAEAAHARKEERAALQNAERERENIARTRRESREAEEQRRQGDIARMEEESRQERNAAIAQRERAEEEERQRFEEARRAEEEKEQARIQAIMDERNREMEKTEAKSQSESRGAHPRSNSRSRSRPRSRPNSRPASSLRGAIPEQPPDNVVGQIRDSMADELGQPKPGRNAAHGVASTAGIDASETQPVPHPATPPQQTHTQTPQTQHQQQQQSPSTTATPSNASPGTVDTKKPVNTLVLVERMRNSNGAVSTDDSSVSYGNRSVTVTEVASRDAGALSYKSQVLQNVCGMACKGFNAAILSSEAPNTAGLFQSPVWPVLVGLVKSLLGATRKQDETLEINCALAFVRGDKVRDLWKEDSTFEVASLETSPISGPTVRELEYISVTERDSFESMLTTALTRAENDAVLSSSTEGFIGALLQVKQLLVVDNVPDLLLSSIVVTSAGSNTAPYRAPLERERNFYTSMLHLYLLGPTMTCYMLNVADDDAVTQSPVPEGSTMSQELDQLLDTLQSMSECTNLALRSGSVRRFLHYVSRNYEEAKSRLKNDRADLTEDKIQRLERYVSDSEVLVSKHQKMLEDAIAYMKEL